MELFQISIPVLEETCKGLSKDIEHYTRIANEVKVCCNTLTSGSWEGYARDCFVEKSQVWYNETKQFINQLTALHLTLSGKVLPRAIELNQKALRFPEILEGGGGGSGSENLLTYNEDSQETIDYCHRMLQADYEEVWDLLESGRKELSGLSYAERTKDKLTSEIKECIEEIVTQKARLQALQSEMREYGEGIRELESEVIKDMSQYEMPEGWTSGMVEIHRQFGSFKTIEAGVLTHNWSQMQEYIDKVWETLPDRERKELIDQLKQELMGKEILGVNDPRKQLAIVVLEEKGYLVINNRQISLQAGYIEEAVGALSGIQMKDGSFQYSWNDNGRLLEQGQNSQEALLKLVEIFKLLPVETMAELKQLVGADRISMEAYERLKQMCQWYQLPKLEQEKLLVLQELEANKDRLMTDLGLDEKAFEQMKAHHLVIVELWGEYEKAIEAYQRLDVETRLDLYGLEGNPETEYIFLTDPLLMEYGKEERLAMLREIQGQNGVLSREAYERITGKSDPYGMMCAKIEISHSGSLCKMTYGDVGISVAQSENERISGFAFILLAALTATYSYKSNNPEAYEGNLDSIYRLDRMELDSKNGFKSYEYVPLTPETLKWLNEKYPIAGDPNFVGPIANEGSGQAINAGFDTTRINVANGPTRFSPSNNAGLEHVKGRHFSPGKNAGQFSITVDELKDILGRKDVINTVGTISQESGQYVRVVDVGQNIGTVKPSIPEVGGQSTSWIAIYTDVKGNLITIYPVPAPH
ncbi:hypothetical protein [Lacrimispora brassicae]